MSLLGNLHGKYVGGLRNESRESQKLSHWMSTHLRVSGVYWGLSALQLLGVAASDDEREQIAQFVLSCRNCDGGFGGHGGHESHLLYTLSAVQVLRMLNVGDDLFGTPERTAAWVAGLQQVDGSFSGDRWGEIDTRFSYSALNCLALLDALHLVDVDAAVRYVLRCQNWDGGFGVQPGAESHAGQIFCCIGALSIANRLGDIDADRVAWWLAER